jgi:hypothetical protein
VKFSGALKIAAVAGFVTLAAFGAWSLAKPFLTDWKAVAKAEGQQADVATQTTQVIEKTFTNERTIYRQAEVAADAIQNEPGADEALPPAIRDGVLSAVDGLRIGSASGAGERP